MIVSIPWCLCGVREEDPVWEDQEVSEVSISQTGEQRGCKILSGHMAEDHVHLCMSIPPKHAVSEVIGYLEGNRAIAAARQFGKKQENFHDANFRAGGYAVSTVGFERVNVQEHIVRRETLEINQNEGRC